MSRIGNATIVLPKEVTVIKDGDVVVIKGPKGEIRLPMSPVITFILEGDTVRLEIVHHDKASKSLHGYMRAAIYNAVVGVTRGWTRTLELAGVGYRATVTGVNLVLSVGFSHQVTIAPPAGITFTVNENKILVTGIDRQVVGQTAAIIRDVKKPEPYKGKGIKYEGEYIRKKAGKAKAVGGAPGAK